MGAGGCPSTVRMATDWGALMDAASFEDKLRSAGKTHTRRAFAGMILKTAAAGLAVSVLEACSGKKAVAHVVTPSPSPTGCQTGSACNQRHYCDPDNKCIC